MSDTSDPAPPPRPIAADPEERESKTVPVWVLWLVGLLALLGIALFVWLNSPAAEKEEAALPSVAGSPATPVAPDIVVLVPALPGAADGKPFGLKIEGLDRFSIVETYGGSAVMIESAKVGEIKAICDDITKKGTLVIDGRTYSIAVGADRKITVAGYNIGQECLMEEWEKDLRWIWKQRETEHKMTGEFTSPHLDAVIALMKADKLVLFTKQRWNSDYSTYRDGDDLPYVEAALLNREGDLRVYAFEMDGVLYLVEWQRGCDKLCFGADRIRVWHLHKVVRKAAKSKPRATKKSSPAPATKPTFLVRRKP
jgi:hypothetical protein